MLLSKESGKTMKFNFGKGLTTVFESVLHLRFPSTWIVVLVIFGSFLFPNDNKFHLSPIDTNASNEFLRTNSLSYKYYFFGGYKFKFSGDSNYLTQSELESRLVWAGKDISNLIDNGQFTSTLSTVSFLFGSVFTGIGISMIVHGNVNGYGAEVAFGAIGTIGFGLVLVGSLALKLISNHNYRSFIRKFNPQAREITSNNVVQWKSEILVAKDRVSLCVYCLR